jgi:hypothetical protein
LIGDMLTGAGPEGIGLTGDSFACIKRGVIDAALLVREQTNSHALGFGRSARVI